MSALPLKSVTRGDIKAAYIRLKSQPARSTSTMLGVVLAVGAVIVILGIGEGVKMQVQTQVNRLGQNVLLIRPSSRGGLSASVNSLAGFGNSASLSMNDLQAVQSLHSVAQATPLGVVSGKVMTDDGNSNFSGAVISTGPALADLLKQRVDYGDFISDTGDPNRVAIGTKVADKFFGESVPLGRSFTFHGQTFLVGGVMHDFQTNPLLGDVDFNNAILMNYTALQNLDNTPVPIYEILARVAPTADINRTAEVISQKLTQLHGGANDVAVLRQNGSLAATNNILNLLTEFIIGAAAVTMLIGSIGIMNIMFVAVAERTHEIGIRKAIGATSRQILSQFMIEAAVLSITGAAIGAVVAGLMIWLIRVFSDWQPVVPWVGAGLTVLIAVTVGTIFGTVPALQAARKDPIEALRGE